MNDSDTTERSLVEAIDFAEEKTQNEVDALDFDVPEHAEKLFLDLVNNLQQTLLNIEMRKQSEGEVPEKSTKTAIEEDAVDIFFAFGSLQHEYDLDIGAAIEHRMDFVEDYWAFEDAAAEAEDDEEVMAAFEEHMAEHAEENPFAQMGEEETIGIEPGTNVDDDEYDHDDTDRHVA